MALVILVSLLLYVASNAQICPNQDRVCDKEGECCSKYGFCGTGEEWCRETWNFNETDCPDCICNQETPETTEPFEENCMCTCYGDPHCKMWNCAVNSWQGPHLVDPIHVYYMTPCNGYTHDHMPFDLIGVNQRYDDYFTSLDYTILKLYGPESAQVCIKNKGNEGVSYNTDCGAVYDTQPEQNKTITVGIFFEMLWYFKNGYSRLYIRNKMKECQDENNDWDLTIITMTATDKEESVQMSVSDCYNKYTCGMCGDFYNIGLNFQTSDGNIIELDDGAWGGTANDETGLTYAVDDNIYDDDDIITTETPMRRLVSDNMHSIISEPCFGLREDIEMECNEQLREYAKCCWDRKEFCKDIIVNCGWDSCSCVMGKAHNITQAQNENIIDLCITNVLNASMNFVCGLDANRFVVPDMTIYRKDEDVELVYNECKDCNVVGNIILGIVIGCVVVSIMFGVVCVLIIKPKLNQKRNMDPEMKVVGSAINLADEEGTDIVTFKE
eukprot:236947_1